MQKYYKKIIANKKRKVYLLYYEILIVIRVAREVLPTIIFLTHYLFVIVSTIDLLILFMCVINAKTLWQYTTKDIYV